MMRIAFLILFVVYTKSTQYVPIPGRPDGLSVGGGKSDDIRLHLEVFYDLLCPYSKQSFATLKEAFAIKDVLSNDGFRFTIHFFPLVFHREAYTMSEGVHFIQSKYGNEAAFNFVELIYKNQDSFGADKTYNMTRFAVEEAIADLIENNLPNNISKEIFLEGIRNSTTDMASRTSWKYGCSKGVSGTPIYFANGVLFDAAGGFNSTDFSNFFEQYLNPNDEVK